MVDQLLKGLPSVPRRKLDITEIFTLLADDQGVLSIALQFGDFFLDFQNLVAYHLALLIKHLMIQNMVGRFVARCLRVLRFVDDGWPLQIAHLALVLGSVALSDGGIVTHVVVL